MPNSSLIVALLTALTPTVAGVLIQHQDSRDLRAEMATLRKDMQTDMLCLRNQVYADLLMIHERVPRVEARQGQ